MALGPENFQIEVAEFYVDAVRVIPGVPIEVDPAISHTVVGMLPDSLRCD